MGRVSEDMANVVTFAQGILFAVWSASCWLIEDELLDAPMDKMFMMGVVRKLGDLITLLVGSLSIRCLIGLTFLCGRLLCR